MWSHIPEIGPQPRWVEETAAWRAQNPVNNLCVDCLAEGVENYGPYVDHIVEPGFNDGLFWNQANWAARCERHIAEVAPFPCNTEGLPPLQRGPKGKQ